MFKQILEKIPFLKNLMQDQEQPSAPAPEIHEATPAAEEPDQEAPSEETQQDH